MLGPAGAWPTGWVRLGDAEVSPVGVGLGLRARRLGADGGLSLGLLS